MHDADTRMPEFFFIGAKPSRHLLKSHNAFFQPAKMSGSVLWGKKSKAIFINFPQIRFCLCENLYRINHKP